LHWFDISSINTDALVSSDVLAEYRPPFEKCAVVWHGATKDHYLYEALMVVSGRDPQEGIVVSLHKGAVGQMPRALPLMVYLMDGDQLRYGPAEEGQTVSREEAELTLALVAAWYEGLSRGSHGFIPTIKDTFTNRRRIKAGKPPAYEWRTVVIGARPMPSAPKGGTHAPPRLHDRRGHLRRLRSGKDVWVRPCKVGDPSRGVVFHDYVIKEAQA
jgi:hypothetical protein